MRIAGRCAASCWRQWCLLLVLAASPTAVAQDGVAPVLPPPGIDLNLAGTLPGLAELPAIDLPGPEPVTETEPEAEPVEGEALVEAIVEPAPHWYQPGYWFCTDCWDAGVEFGLNGTDGLNQAQSIRTGGHLRRETDVWKFDSNIVFNRNSANKVETQNNALHDARLDRIIAGSRWTLFLSEQLLYDEFQAFDLRLAINGGVGYQFFDRDWFDLTGRVGAGASREFGGPDDSIPAEALFGLESQYKISDMQRLAGRIDYFPEWEDFGRYRIVADVGWEIDLDRPANVSLKFSVIERYDSTPNGADPHQLDYAALLIWGL